MYRSFLFAPRFAISQAGIAARTVTLMQGSEGKECTTNRPDLQTCQMCILTTTPQMQHLEFVKVPYLTQIIEKKAIHRNEWCCNFFIQEAEPVL